MADDRAPSSVWTGLGPSVAVATFVLSVVGSIGGIIIGNLEREIGDLKGSVADLNVRMAPLLTLYAQHNSDKVQSDAMKVSIDDKVGLPEYRAFDRMITERITALDATDTARNAEIRDQVHRLEENIVPRSEDTFHWDTVTALALKVDNMNKTGACTKTAP